ncbi:hypothetical protein [Paraferrimonas sedimenticola]|uniref:Uncharacterized protein n=1 Tax=Paraferrimonas sedimenticola TaxID=375674 RepID=A0AA37VYD6_9GAMM|nr:hypothetical protein [Paraferrimonas sedimenticola]GLP96986.1 hypothetical protein GCM10007895_22920 [Paraferrimonas sedimenticola]
MHFLTRLLPSFLISWLLSFTLASLFHSQYVVNQLVSTGAKVSFGERIGLTLDDWLGLLPAYGAIIAIGLVIAFLIAGWLSKRLSQHRTALYTLAGLVAFTTFLLAMEIALNISVVAGARGWGFYAQLLAGAAGGYAFARLTQNHEKR